MYLHTHREATSGGIKLDHLGGGWRGQVVDA